MISKRQGDLLFIAQDTKPIEIKTAKTMQRKDSSVIAQGESTGHSHTIHGGTIYEDSAVRYLVLDPSNTCMTVMHPEHAPIVLEARIAHVWKIVQQREYVSVELSQFVED